MTKYDTKIKGCIIFKTGRIMVTIVQRFWVTKISSLRLYLKKLPRNFS